MSEHEYSLLVDDAVERLCTNEKEKIEVYQHLIITSEYFAAHGRFEWECDNDVEHTESLQEVEETIKRVKEQR